jgi:hypothetical protein
VRALLLAPLALAWLTSTAPAASRAPKAPAAQERARAVPARTRHTVVLPSLTMDPVEMRKVAGAHHYEHRAIAYSLLSLRDPNQHVTLVTSTPIDPAIVDYYLGLIPETRNARARLHLLDAGDESARPLSAKVLEQPQLQDAISAAVHGWNWNRLAASTWRRLQRAIRAAEGGSTETELVPFVATSLEHDLASRLKLPLVGSQPGSDYWGTKSGSRRLFREAGVPHPDGAEDLRSEGDLAAAIQRLMARNPKARRVVIKLNEGFSGEGLGILDTTQLRGRDVEAIRAALPSMKFVAAGENWPHFTERLAEQGGIAELYLPKKSSPSVQGFIHPDGRVEILSTHEQILGGPGGVIYLGARFPADPAYRQRLEELGLQIGKHLQRKGSRGRFAVDFVATPRPRGRDWDIRAIEINDRQGGTTHPWETTRLLIDGHRDPETGELVNRQGQPKFYRATDNVVLDNLAGVEPARFLAAVKAAGLAWDAQTQTGVVFHLMSTLRDHGKVGFTAIANSPLHARRLYARVNRMLAGLRF